MTDYEVLLMRRIPKVNRPEPVYFDEHLAAGLARKWCVFRTYCHIKCGENDELLICDTAFGKTFFFNERMQSSERIISRKYYTGLGEILDSNSLNGKNALVFGGVEGIICRFLTERGVRLIDHYPANCEASNICRNYLPYAFITDDGSDKQGAIINTLKTNALDHENTEVDSQYGVIFVGSLYRRDGSSYWDYSKIVKKTSSILSLGGILILQLRSFPNLEDDLVERLEMLLNSNFGGCYAVTCVSEECVYLVAKKV